MGRQVAITHDVYSIEQLATVSLDGHHKPPIVLTPELREELERRGGTAGYLTRETPPGLRVLAGFDAVILSTDNQMI